MQDEDRWLEARSISEITKHRTEMLGCSLGTDVDHAMIMERLSIADASALEIEEKWFDICSTRFANLFHTGRAKIYRAVAVDDVARFVQKIGKGAAVGSHWTYDRECATTSLHPGEWKPHDLLLAGEVDEDNVDWATTFQKNFSHPEECEIFVDGKVLVTEVINMTTNSPLSWTPRALQT